MRLLIAHLMIHLIRSQALPKSPIEPHHGICLNETTMDIGEPQFVNKETMDKKIRTNSITCILILLVVIVVVVGMLAYNHKYSTLIFNCMNSLVERTTNISLNVVNKLSNRITIGTSLGDFVANLYNAFGFYDLLYVETRVSFINILNCFQYWCANNDYNNVYFTNKYYNDDRSEVLPFYIGDNEDGKNMPYEDTWHLASSYGYSLSFKPDYLQKIGDKYIKDKSYLFISKTANIYAKLELDATPFKDYKDKFMKFLYENLSSLRKMVNEDKDAGTSAINTDTMMIYYQYFIIINKLKRQFYDCSYESYIPKVIAGKKPDAGDYADVRKKYPNETGTDDEMIEKDKQRNLCYALLTNTYTFEVVGTYGETKKVSGMKVNWTSSGFSFIKA